MSENKQERIVIISKARGMKYENQFFADIDTAYQDGYRLARNNRREDACLRNFRGSLGKVVMYLEGCDPGDLEPVVVPEIVEEDDPLGLKEVPEEVSTGAPENKPIEEKEESNEKEESTDAEEEGLSEAGEVEDKEPADKAEEKPAPKKRGRPAKKK